MIAPIFGRKDDELDIELLDKISKLVRPAKNRHAADAPVTFAGIVVREAHRTVRHLRGAGEKSEGDRSVVRGADDEDAALARPWSDREDMTQPERERACSDEQDHRKEPIEDENRARVAFEAEAEQDRERRDARPEADRPNHEHRIADPDIAPQGPVDACKDEGRELDSDDDRQRLDEEANPGRLREALESDEVARVISHRQEGDVEADLGPEARVHG